MIIKTLKVDDSRNYLNGQPLSHLVWDHYNPNNKWQKGMIVHHIDKDTLNDHISNLILLTRAEHNVEHHIGNKYFLGKKHSVKTKKKMSEKQKGSNNSMFGKPSPMEGKKHKETTKVKISETKKNQYVKENHPLYGKFHSEETKQKLSDKAKVRFAIKENNPMFGRKHTEDSKQKMSLAKKKGSHINGH